MLKSDGQPGELTQDLLETMSRMKPVCPIVLHATTQAVANFITAQLSKANWTIHPVIAEGESWIKDRWQNLAAQLLTDELKKRPAPSEADS